MVCVVCVCVCVCGVYVCVYNQFSWILKRVFHNYCFYMCVFILVGPQEGLINHSIYYSFDTCTGFVPEQRFINLNDHTWTTQNNLSL